MMRIMHEGAATMKKSNYILISLLLLIGIFCAASVSYALDAPHTPVGVAGYDVNCAYCHYPLTAATPAWATAAPPAGSTKLNQLCLTCHNPSNGIPVAKFADVQTHSSYVTNPTDTLRIGVYLMECRTCHNPHLQNQMRALPADGNLDFGTTTNVTATLLSDSTKSWGVDQFKDALLIPNTAYIAYTYRILSNTKDTLTILGAMKTMSPYTGVGKPYRIKYGKLIKTSIPTPNSGAKPVTFLTNSGGLTSFASTTATVKGVCQVCHTKTKYFLGSGAVLDGGHPATYDANCTVFCHQHKYGFKAGCNGCHGQSGATGAPLIGTDLVSPATGHTVGAHQKHAVTLTIGCDVCHSGNGMPTTDNIITVAFSGIGTGGAYQGKTLSVPYVYSAGVPTGATESCSTVYCHSSGQSADGASATPVYTTPDWEAPASGACGTCHATTAPDISTGSHTTHLTTDTNCGNCHTGASASAYVSASHVNKSIDVANAYTAGGAPGNGYGTCSTASCHANVYAVGTSPTPTWGTTGNGCSACHTAPNTIAASGPPTGSHSKHYTNNNVSVVCTACHNAGTTMSTKPTTSHTDGDIDIVNVGYPANKTKGSAFSTCATACHGATTRTWGQTSTGCNYCHPYTANDWATSNPTGTALAVEGFGAHAKHIAHLVSLGGVLTPATDSFGSGASWTNVCGVCHNGASHTLDGTVGSRQISVQAGYQFGASAPLYTGIIGNSSSVNPKSCSNVSCHFQTTPVWSTY